MQGACNQGLHLKSHSVVVLRTITDSAKRCTNFTHWNDSGQEGCKAADCANWEMARMGLCFHVRTQVTWQMCTAWRKKKKLDFDMALFSVHWIPAQWKYSVTLKEMKLTQIIFHINIWSHSKVPHWFHYGKESKALCKCPDSHANLSPIRKHDMNAKMLCVVVLSWKWRNWALKWFTNLGV